MDNVCELRKLIINKAVSKNLKAISDASAIYGMNIDFSREKFLDFHYNLFDIYEYHNEIYKYMDELELSIIVAITNSMYNNKKLSLEDIRDGIFYVKSLNKDEFSNIKILNKIKYLKEN